MRFSDVARSTIERTDFTLKKRSFTVSVTVSDLENFVAFNIYDF